MSTSSGWRSRVDPSLPFRPTYLCVERGPGAGQRLEVRQGTSIIGRASDSDLRLQHLSVSRRHAQLLRRGNRFFLTDLGSRNGTMVRAARVEGPVELAPGDTLGVGDAVLRLGGANGIAKVQPGAWGPLQALARQAAQRPGAVLRWLIGPLAARWLHLIPLASAGALLVAGLVAFVALLVAGPRPWPVRPAVAVATAMAAGPAASREIPPGAREPLGVPRPGSATSPTSATGVAGTAAAPRPIQAAATNLHPAPPPRKPSALEAPRPLRTATRGVAGTPEALEAPRPLRTVTALRPGQPHRKPAALEGARPLRTASPALGPAQVGQPEAEPPRRDRPPVRELPAATAPAPAPDPGPPLAAYERGDAEAAVEAAMAAREPRLAQRLRAFLRAHDQATEALLANRGGEAIEGFQRALALDAGLSGGRGAYRARIRARLAGLHFLAGLQAEQDGDPGTARLAFRAAVEHDPGLARARTHLDRLEGRASLEADAAGQEAPRRARAPLTPLGDPAAP